MAASANLCSLTFAGFIYKCYACFIYCLILTLPFHEYIYGLKNSIKGVAISMKSSYNPDLDFTCLDGSVSLPFHKVNDDYCDCRDGSDEPGTSACINGKFHCTNAGYLPLYIFSSRVNDGICDCCDGTDEYSTLVNCSNTCKELGKAWREEIEMKRKLLLEGYQIYLDYQKSGKEAKQLNQVKLEEILSQKQALENSKNEAETFKNEKEQPEKEAKERQDKEWEVIKAEKEKQNDEKKIEAAFKELDTNEDNQITVDEMQNHLEFDVNSDSQVSHDEAKEYLQDNEVIQFDVFKEKVWPNIKQIYKKVDAVKSETPKAPSTVDPPQPSDNLNPAEDTNEDNESDERDDDNDDNGDNDEGREDEPDSNDKDSAKEEEEEEFIKPDYDDDTKKLIEEADEARNKFKEAEDKLNQHNSEVREINDMLQLDMGPNHEFFPFKDHCFELTDREYIYKICPFSRVSQRPKNGGSETNLGNWGIWSGPEDNKYIQMKYERGTGCWNGPDRSATVNLQCGLKNELISSSEPSRCEYLFYFTTPALCNQQPTTTSNTDHDEL